MSGVCEGRGCRALSACLAALFLAAVPSPAQDPPEFGEVVDVRLVSVEVWVTDASGLPVRGLAADDFEVLEDGEPVPVRYFSEVHQQLAQRPRQSPSAVAAPDTEAVPPAADEPSTTLVFYLDELHLRPASQRRLVEAIRGFLSEARFPSERVMIARQTNVLLAETTFGSRKADVEAALDRLAKPNPIGGIVEQKKRTAVDELQRLWVWNQEQLQVSGQDPCEQFTEPAVREVELYAAEARQRVQTSLSHLARLVGMLTAVPGMKTLVYLSDSLETSPGVDLLGLVWDLCPIGQREASALSFSADLIDAFHRLTRDAAANRVTIYALQPSGLRTGTFGVAEQGQLDMRALSGLQSATRLNERTGLSQLALETGGRAVFDHNDMIDPLRTLADEVANYYSLAYEPPHAADGAEHRIEVRLRNPDLRVRHRTGYRDKLSSERTREKLQAALLLGILDNRLGARLGAGVVERLAAGDRFALPLHVLLPAGNLVFTPKARLSLVALAFDPQGRRRDEKTATVTLDRPDAEGAQISLLTRFELEAGEYVFVVSVRDETSGEEAVVSTRLRVPLAGSD